MQELTPEGRRAVADVAARNGFSPEAALTLLRALAQGNGGQAQFHHPELGGMGQWSPGGMIMIGDMFNNALKARVDSLCHELADLLRTQPASPASGLFAPGEAASRWPADLGAPASVGSQNDLSYAYFPQSRRLVVAQGGTQRIYDSGEHRISGVSQQQGAGQTLSFTSQLGRVRLDDLPLVSPRPDDPAPAPSPKSAPGTHSAPPAPHTAQSDGDAVLSLIERLADLRAKGVLTEEEFLAKKRELLSRL